MQLAKRMVPMMVAFAILVTLMSPMAGAVSNGRNGSAYTVSKKTDSQLHPFTSTEDLIRDAVEDLRSLGITQQEKESDKSLISKVEKATDMTYDTVKATLATELKDGLSDGKLDVGDLGLTKEVLSQVLSEVLEDNYLYNAVTDLSYTTVGGKVTKIGFDVTEGYAAAMGAMKGEMALTEEESGKVDVTDAAAQAAAEQVTEDAPVEEPAVATFAMRSANAGIATADETDGEPVEDETEDGCVSHTVGAATIGDFNEDEKYNIADVVALNVAILNDEIDEIGDINEDGILNIADVVALNVAILNDDLPTYGSGEISYTWAEYQDYTPKLRTNENGEYLDADGNVTTDYTQAITNGGLLYNPQDGTISEGILADVYYKLTALDFTCSVCGQDIHMADDPETEEDELASFSMTQDIYINLNTYESVACNPGETPVLGEGETMDDYLYYTDMQIGMYYDDTFGIMIDPDGNPILDENGNPVPNYIMDESGNPVLDEEGNVQVIGLYTSDPMNNGAAEVAYYYSILSAFNADKAEYFGISSDYWTGKNSEANPMAALKVLCNLDPNTDIPPAQMIQMVQMLPQAFMAYVYYYGAELLAMRDAAMDSLEAAGGDDLTDVQKLLVIHDWLAENAVFDMGSMLDISGTGGSNDPIQMTTFGALLSNQLTTIQGSGYYGGICLAYAAAYNYLVQAAYPDIYMTEEQVDEDGDGEVDVINDVWCTPAQVDAKGGDIVDFSQVMFYCDTAETSIAGEGFGGGAFNNVHYFNAVKLEDAPQDPNAEDEDMNGEWFYVDSCYDDIYVECLAQYRVEAEGSVYHSYFLVSPQTMGTLWGDSIDYIDSPYDGYTYIPQVDEYGNPTQISNNISEDSANYDPTHPEYVKTEAEGESYNHNTCYEDSWFSGAISKIYNDGDNWYYVDSETNSSSYSGMMDENGEISIDKEQMEENGLSMDTMMHSTRVSADSQDKMKSRPMTAPDWWEEEEDDDSTGSMGFDMTNKEDTYATVLFDYGTGAINGTVTTDKALLAAIEEDFIYNDQFPSLTHSLAVADDAVYFNLGNQIWKTTTDGAAPTLFREYNSVSATSDGRDFKGSSYVLDAAGTDLVVENNPVAAIALRNTYTPLYDYLDADGNLVLDYTGTPGDAYKEELMAGTMTEQEMQAAIVGRSFVMMAPQETVTVNIGTNYSFSSAFDGAAEEEKMSTIYTKEAVHYNPDYSMGLSDESANKNEEFLWCANIREDVALADWAASVGAEDKVPCTAKNNGHDYEYSESENTYICSNCNLHATNIVAEVEHATITLSAIADSGMSEDFINQNGGSSEETSTTTIPVSPAREAATTETGDIVITVVPEDGYGLPMLQYLEEGAAEPVAISLTEEVGEDGNKTGAYVGTLAKTLEDGTTLGCLTIGGELVATADLTVAKAENGTVSAVTTTPVEPEGDEDNAEGEEPEGEEGAESAPAADLSVGEGETVSVRVGDLVTVTATPDEGYVLDSLKATYQEELQGADEIFYEERSIEMDEEAGSYIFTMPEFAVTITAKFAKSYTVTAEETENGTVEADPAVAKAGDKVTLTVEAAEGYKLVENSLKATYITMETVPGVGEEADTTVETTVELEIAEDGTFTMPAADVTVTAAFEAIPVVTYSVTVNETEYAEIDADKDSAAEGETVILTIRNVAEGHEFVEFEVYAEGGMITITENDDGTYQFVMPASSVTVYATTRQAREPKEITVTASENGTVTADKEKAKEGETVTLTIVPGEGYKLDTLSIVWEMEMQGSGGEVFYQKTECEWEKGEDGTYTFEMPEEDVTVTAAFEAIEEEPGNESGEGSDPIPDTQE